jgi:hypothetical protein
MLAAIQQRSFHIEAYEFLANLPAATYIVRHECENIDERGIASFVGFFGGRLVGIQIKPHDEILNQDEEDFKFGLLMGGGLYFVVRSFDELYKIAKERTWL